MVDSPDVVHLKQLTAGKQTAGDYTLYSDTDVDKQTSSSRNLKIVLCDKQILQGTLVFRWQYLHFVQINMSTYSRRDLRLTKCLPWPWGGRKCLRENRVTSVTSTLLWLREKRGKLVHMCWNSTHLVLSATEKNLHWQAREVDRQHLSLLLSLSDSGGEKTAGTGAGSRLADSSIKLSMKSLTWLSNWRIRSLFRNWGTAKDTGRVIINSLQIL